MRGCVIFDSRGRVLWVGHPVTDESQSHTGHTAWEYSATPDNAEKVKRAWAEALANGHATVEAITNNHGVVGRWLNVMERIDATPIIACAFSAIVENRLAKRELEIAMLFASDWKPGEIAERLGISPHTVETVRQRILAKLGVRGIAGITRWLIRAGLIDA